MQLSDFILDNKPHIIREWENLARTLNPSKNMTRLQLRDHIDGILSFIAKSIASPQTFADQACAMEAHVDLRQGEGFDIVAMVSEYRALRSSVITLWTKAQQSLTDADVRDLTRFNESIDQALVESVARFTAKVDYSKDLLLGVLGHDIRSPLGAITMCAHLMTITGPLNEKQTDFVHQIDHCTTRITQIVASLLDLIRARTGSGLPIVRQSMDFGMLTRQIVGELSVQQRGCAISLDITGDVAGEWDSTRLGQLISNLIGNALQYGTPGAPIDIHVSGNAKDVILSIHNTGDPIPATRLTTIFDSFTRGVEGKRGAVANLGLGLFIAREIVTSHGGTIEVTSDETRGTTFTVRLPRSERRQAA